MEEFKDLASMKKEEMQASLDAHEQRMKEVQTKSKWKLHYMHNQIKIRKEKSSGHGIEEEVSIETLKKETIKKAIPQIKNMVVTKQTRVEEERRNLTETVINVTIVKSIATIHMSDMQINKKDTSEDVVKLAR
ncbi:hypothetical protein MTR_8g014250 [Medicago truncatula]|uniref:Uncharacterized protein n=1 Tax=Medicago truncatula TaxID=3880 RepID=G7LGM3_MEDTR|nr:hypothetical protein MTR_8g014250 [Medicago truncatula]